ncbi:glucose 1-dehydrogenase [Natronolimnobius sp. AArcel1]|uniref:SDR family NAD(P)-dependent oxidoreductase n=1 Tax=Natronolimnobius sp. AArcel1 TaxID=1679093 RepID=UPI0013E9F6C5|nr:glucose 1-dehydrogenase [Natronolimnobius sp. AArcel1]NGM70370.1 glucose 1-dehydrogenase [Natronolimnobius sp. AArcel1]
MSVLEQFSLAGNTAIVTGGNRGIGKGIATALATAGADVVIANRDGERGQKAATDIATETDATVEAIPADITDEDDVDQLVKATVNAFGSVDVLVNNAGIVRNAPAEEMTLETWSNVLESNLTGAYLCSKRVGREMIDNDGGSVITVSSISSFIANHPQPQASYQASKSGVDGLTRQLASEWAEYGIRVNTINPGYVRTDLIEGVLETDPEMAAVWYDGMLQEEMAQPEDIGSLAVYLASDAASYVTGESITIDGGYTVR